MQTFLIHFSARKTKKGRQTGKVIQQPTIPERNLPPLPEARSLVPKPMPQLVPTMLSLLKAIEPDTIYAGYDSTIPDTSTRLMTTLNRLGGRQVISAVKWAKALPGTAWDIFKKVLQPHNILKNSYFALFRVPEPSPGRSDDPPAMFLAVPHVFWTGLEIISAV